MIRPRLALTIGLMAAVAGIGTWRHMRAATDDFDRDGLSDRLEADLAASHLPAIHQYVNGAERDECLLPDVRPVLYRARPLTPSRPSHEASDVVITYVLLYLEDCGALGHRGDAESFAILLHRDPDREDWRTVSSVAVAHQGTPAEYRSTGNGRDIWVSRNKHANYASFSACGDNEFSGDVCAEFGPPPPRWTLLNVGEPDAPLADDVGLIEPQFRSSRIWHHEPFLEAGDLTAELTESLDFSTVPPLSRTDHER